MAGQQRADSLRNHGLRRATPVQTVPANRAALEVAQAETSRQRKRADKAEAEVGWPRDELTRARWRAGQVDAAEAEWRAKAEFAPFLEYMRGTLAGLFTGLAYVEAAAEKRVEALAGWEVVADRCGVPRSTREEWFVDACWTAP
jgi:hypothetical protein